MDPAPNQANVYRLLFRMAARAAEFDTNDFQSRLVTSIANRYGASACSIYRCGKRRSTAWAQTAADVMGAVAIVFQLTRFNTLHYSISYKT